MGRSNTSKAGARHGPFDSTSDQGVERHVSLAVVGDFESLQWGWGDYTQRKYSVRGSVR